MVQMTLKVGFELVVVCDIVIRFQIRNLCVDILYFHKYGTLSLIFPTLGPNFLIMIWWTVLTMKDIELAKLPDGKRANRRKEGFRTCGNFCVVCTLGENATIHSDKRTGEEWKIHSELTCKSTDVVYKIGCRRCSDFTYIGETSRRFSTRIGEHKGHVTRKDLTIPVGAHFNTKGHSIADMLPIAIEQVLPKGNTLLRRHREKLWIRKYQAVEHGANRRG